MIFLSGLESYRKRRGGVNGDEHLTSSILQPAMYLQRYAIFFLLQIIE